MKRRRTIASDESPLRPRQEQPVYPFTAIVGQEEMKLALLLNVIDPHIGGVLIMGHRGTGKSTAVRALADLLPKIERVRDCLYGCDPQDESNLCADCFARHLAGEKLKSERALVPVAELPLGSTEDRVCGTIDIERALREGVRAFEPGVLARANRGFLYIDEVNLLEDHLIDLLLDVAVTGRNRVEREGISIEHPARFRLVGSGNPEEGELRPQLLDRFGLHVEIRTAADLDERVRIVEQREAFDRDPLTFREQSESEQHSLRRRIISARKKLPLVELSRDLLRRIAELCQQLKIDGHRGELTISRAARALSAFEGRKSVTEEDIRRVAAMALRHRLRRDPLEQTGGSARLDQQLDKSFPPESDSNETKDKGGSTGQEEPPPSKPAGGGDGNGTGGRKGAGGNASGTQGDNPQRDSPPALDARLTEESLEPREPAALNHLSRPQSKGRRAGARINSDNALRGRYVRASSTMTSGAKVALDATLRASLINNHAVREVASAAQQSTDARFHPSITSRDFRYKRFKQKAGTLFIFAVDTSGSMAINRIAQAKGALTRLLQQAYIKRDRVALISFRGQGADVLLRASGSATRAKRLLDALSMGGATPLAAGLMSALQIARNERRSGAKRIVLLLFTDGRANVPYSFDEKLFGYGRQRWIEDELQCVGAALRQVGVTTIVVDTQNRFTSGGEGQRLAQTVQGRYVYLPVGRPDGEKFASLVQEARQPHR
jgi:magnesium chelatase subunit D